MFFNRNNAQGFFGFMSYWQALRWHRSHEFWLILLLGIGGWFMWEEKSWSHYLGYHIALPYILLLFCIVPVMQVLYALNFVCFDVMIKRLGWLLVAANVLMAVVHAVRLYLVWHHYSGQP